jgi:diguanylate cyclase (GGDEF)-like protein
VTRKLSVQQRMSELLHTLHAVSSVTDLERLLLLILKSAKKTMEAEASSLMLLDHARGELYFHQVRGGNRDVAAIRLKVGQGIAGKVAQTGRPMIVNDVSKSRYFFAGADKKTGFKTRQILAVPLKVRRVVIGVLEAINTVSGRGFSKSDLELFTFFADQAAVAIENTRLYNMAAYDGLTRVFTRRYFDGWFASEFARVKRYQRPLSLMMIDLDKFKSVNDSMGHPGGDYVLSTTSQVIKSQIRTSDTLARFGGEEFIVALTETSPDRASQVAERIRAAVENYPYVFKEWPLKVTLSIGVSAYRNVPDLSASRLLDEADKALYDAKKKRNCVKIWRT